MSDKTKQPNNQDRRTFLKQVSLVPAALYLDGCAVAGGSTGASDHSAAIGQTMIDHVAPPLDKVRIALIGVGGGCRNAGGLV